MKREDIPDDNLFDDYPDNFGECPDCTCCSSHGCHRGRGSDCGRLCPCTED